IEERGGGVRTFLLGVAVGAGVALLLAPRAGRETQRELGRALAGLRDGGVGGAAGSLTGSVGSLRGRVTGRLADVRQSVDDGLGRVRGAVEEGRMAARQARGELRRRLDEAKATYRAGQEGAAPPRPAVASIADAASASRAPSPAKAEGVIREVTPRRDAGDLAR
ncbi:YtxH domain-containing protein, partial [Longimicrobium sp.]|uniref:YtxH domain-containing protein n=1 Tax=Longimicrobium sp. TaxID=2029185 RepID=UPI002E32166A